MHDAKHDADQSGAPGPAPGSDQRIGPGAGRLAEGTRASPADPWRTPLLPDPDGHRTAGSRTAGSRTAGTTLLELALVVALIGIVTAIAVPALGRRRDRVAVLEAARILADALAVARDIALSGAAPVAVRLGETGATVTVTAAADTIERHALGTLLGVSLRATRDSLAYGPDGLGVGAANLTAIVARGSAADTLVVSRLGRVR